MGIFRQKYVLAFVLLGLIFGGTFGYQVIEGWGFLDSLFMTIITLTTTGFGEVHKLSPNGKYFTIVLMVVGVGTVAYSISFFMNEFFSVRLGLNRRWRMRKKIDLLNGHTILCGFGRMGKVIAKELAVKNADFVVIDNDTNGQSEIDQKSYLIVEGDATQDEILEQAGISRASTVATMLGNDADNLYVILAAKDLRPNVNIVSRASDEDAKAKIMRAGADKVVMPLAISAMKVAHTILNPAVEDYLEISGVPLKHDERIQMADLLVDDHPVLVGKDLTTCGFKREGMIILGIKSIDSFVFAPRSDYKFKAGDTLITLSTPEHFQDVLDNI